MSKVEIKPVKDMEIARSSVWARVENVSYGECPLCKQPMKEAVANGIASLVCLNDRIVMPCKNHG